MNMNTNCELIEYENLQDGVRLKTTGGDIVADKIILCTAANVAKHTGAKVKLSYAPMAIVKNVKPTSNSFVELDYYPQNCINLLTKDDNAGLIGGISFSDVNKCDDYIERVFEKHKKYDPGMELLHKYNGVKSEMVLKGEPRNYLYHIKEVKENVWTIIPGKFTLCFSIAPELYRKLFHRNPRKHFQTNHLAQNPSKIMSNTVWQDIIENHNHKKY